MTMDPNKTRTNIAGLDVSVSTGDDVPSKSFAGMINLYRFIESDTPTSHISDTDITAMASMVASNAMSLVISWARSSAKCTTTLTTILRRLIDETHAIYCDHPSEYALIPETYVADQPIGDNTKLSIVKHGHQWEFEISNTTNRHIMSLARSVYDVEKNSVVSSYTTPHLSDTMADRTMRDLIRLCVISK